MVGCSEYSVTCTHGSCGAVHSCSLRKIYSPRANTVRCHYNAASLYILPSSLLYKTHFSRQLNCWSLRCSCYYIFILNLTSGFNGLGKDNYQMRRETFKSWDLVRLILETLRYIELSNYSGRTQIRNLNSQHTPHILPMSWGVSIVRIWGKIGRVITALHCTCLSRD